VFALVTLVLVASLATVVHLNHQAYRIEFRIGMDKEELIRLNGKPNLIFIRNVDEKPFPFNDLVREGEAMEACVYLGDPNFSIKARSRTLFIGKDGYIVDTIVTHFPWWEEYCSNHKKNEDNH